MHATSLLTTALLTTTALAFLDTSPFFLLSTSKSLTPSTHAITHPISTIKTHLHATLASCPSDVYVLAFQPGSASGDYNAHDTPHLARRIEQTESAYVVPEVVGGGLDEKDVVGLLERECGAKALQLEYKTGVISTPSTYPQIIRVSLPELPLDAESRKQKMAEHDSYINALLTEHAGRSLTFVQHSSPPAALTATTKKVPARPSPAENVYQAELRKRNVQRRAADDNSDAGLFERYNFLSPAIFMGGIAVLLLFSILSVGVKALAGVEVSYAAFSKEMGPNGSAAKKQQ